jgi:multidrug resistance efflux pump
MRQLVFLEVGVNPQAVRGHQGEQLRANHTFKGHVASLAPATGSRFSILPAENATGNFTKISFHSR